MKLAKVIILLAATALIIFGLTSLTYNEIKILDVRTVNMSVEVGSSVGFALSNESLTFGVVDRGTGSASRYVDVGNQRPYPVAVRVTTSGDMRDMVQVSPSFVVLNSGETQRIAFVVIAPPDAKFGNYTGKATFIYERDW